MFLSTRSCNIHTYCEDRVGRNPNNRLTTDGDTVLYSVYFEYQLPNRLSPHEKNPAAFLAKLDENPRTAVAEIEKKKVWLPHVIKSMHLTQIHKMHLSTKTFAVSMMRGIRVRNVRVVHSILNFDKFAEDVSFYENQKTLCESAMAEFRAKEVYEPRLDMMIPALLDYGRLLSVRDGSGGGKPEQPINKKAAPAGVIDKPATGQVNLNTLAENRTVIFMDNWWLKCRIEDRWDDSENMSILSAAAEAAEAERKEKEEKDEKEKKKK